jgi:RNA recognition motif-containing protein
LRYLKTLCNTGSAASKQELEESFSYYGPLRNVWVARNPPGFAFVEYEDPRDAEDAVRGLDGRYVPRCHFKFVFVSVVMDGKSMTVFISVDLYDQSSEMP